MLHIYICIHFECIISRELYIVVLMYSYLYTRTTDTVDYIQTIFDTKVIKRKYRYVSKFDFRYQYLFQAISNR